MTGDAPVRAALVTRAAESHAGGLVQLTFQHLERARYVLIWFTLLPQDPAGTYQVSVYDAEIQGRR